MTEMTVIGQGKISNYIRQIWMTWKRRDESFHIINSHCSRISQISPFMMFKFIRSYL